MRKMPIAVPRHLFNGTIVILAALCGAVLGFDFMLLLRGLPVPDEFSKLLVALSGALVLLATGPRSKSADDDRAAATSPAPADATEPPLSDQ